MVWAKTRYILITSYNLAADQYTAERFHETYDAEVT